MLLRHPLVTFLGQYVEKPLYIAHILATEEKQSYALLVDSHIWLAVEEGYTFWHNVRLVKGEERWTYLLHKWNAGASVVAGCPTFFKLSTLICWAYELLMNVQLNPSSVEFALKCIPPQEVR